MKKLIVSGCSWGDKNFISSFHPEMDCDWPKWPELLAEKLNMECVNLCKCGAGQEYIYSSISDYIQSTPKDEIGIVIAAWSTAPRRCFQVRNKWTNDRQDVKGDLIYWINRSIRYQYAFQNLLKQEKLPYIHFQMISLYRGHLWEINKQQYEKNNSKDLKLNTNNIVLGPLYKKLKNETLETLKSTKYKFNDKHLNWPTDEELGGFSLEFSVLKEEHKISELDRHPNAAGQQKIAEYIYERAFNEVSDS